MRGGWLIVARGADPASLTLLFTGWTAVPTTLLLHGRRAFVSMSRCVHPARHTPHTCPRRLTVTRACCARLSELLLHHAEAAAEAAFATEKLQVVRLNSSSIRSTSCCPRRSRAAAGGLHRSAAAARKPSSAPQGPRRPSWLMPRLFVHVVLCRSQVAASLPVRTVRPNWPCS